VSGGVYSKRGSQVQLKLGTEEGAARTGGFLPQKAQSRCTIPYLFLESFRPLNGQRKIRVIVYEIDRQQRRPCETPLLFTYIIITFIVIILQANE
jgi:hypothetical protein